MLSKPIRVAVVSDIHGGHPRNPTARIFNNLDQELNNYRVLETLDLLVIAGDLFDRILSFASEEGRHIDQWIYSLLRRCAKTKTKLRVLEGTPSHDRRQSIRFDDNYNKLKKIKHALPDFKYVDTLEIEYIPDFGINVLYLPDEYGASHEDALHQVKALLAEKKLSTVDFAFMHGMFEHQVPPGVNIPTHRSAEYLELVDYLIFIGHVHTPSSYSRIVAQGSFDRLAHGEEEAKGYVRALVQPDGEYEAVFVENRNAMKFVTVAVEDCDLTEALLRIADHLIHIPDGSFVRVSASKAHPIQQGLYVLSAKWPTYQWSLHVTDKREKIADVLAQPLPSYAPVQIDRSNLLEVVQKRLIQRNYSSEVVQACIRALSEIKAHIN
jgi:DNA repair exonuclease SbcCD nuclease subunit